MRHSWFPAGLAGALAVAAGTAAMAGETTSATTEQVDENTTIVIIEETPASESACMTAIEHTQEQISGHGQAALAEARLDRAREHCADGEYEAAKSELNDALEQLRERQR